MSAIVLAILAASPVTIEVFVPLCDGSQIDCGSRGLGDPRSLERNLYWGAAFGAERFLTPARGYLRIERRDQPDPSRPWILRELVLSRAARDGEREVRLILRAYAGDHIDDALADFLAAASGTSKADVVLWTGHDRLMDVAPPADLKRSPTARPVIVLACSSEQFFGPVLARIGARPLLLTRTFMAPEAYLLDAIARSVARHGLDAKQVRSESIAAYARYQRISDRSAATVFAR